MQNPHKIQVPPISHILSRVRVNALRWDHVYDRDHIHLDTRIRKNWKCKKDALRENKNQTTECNRLLLDVNQRFEVKAFSHLYVTSLTRTHSISEITANAVSILGSSLKF